MLCISYFVLIPVQEMVYLKVVQKITAMDASMSETIDQKSEEI